MSHEQRDAYLADWMAAASGAQPPAGTEPLSRGFAAGFVARRNMLRRAILQWPDRPHFTGPPASDGELDAAEWHSDEPCCSIEERFP